MLEKDRSPKAMAARDAAVLGHPPRVAPKTPEEYSAADRELVRRLKIAAGAPPDDYVPEVMAITLKHPDLYSKGVEYGMALMRGTLPARDREIAILRVGWLSRSPFEWGEHVKMGKRNAGLVDEDVERVIVGPSAPEWSDHDRAILTAVDELLADAMITDATWAKLAERYDDKQLLEFPQLVGHYMLTAYLQNSIRAPLMPQGVGLTAR